VCVNGQFYIEISIKNLSIKPDTIIQKVIDEFIVTKRTNRIVLNIPRTWVGFKDGTLIHILRTYNEGVYLSLAYVTCDDNDHVFSLDSNEVDEFDISIEGKSYKKYVKKDLVIVRELNSSQFEINGYVFNMRSNDPVLHVLSVYSHGEYSRVRVQDVMSLIADKWKAVV